MTMPENSQPMFPTNAYDEALLELHLGRLSENEREALLARIASDADLAAQHEALGQVFATLRMHAVEPPRAGLAERVLARVAAAGPTLRAIPAERRRRAATVPVENERVIRLHSLRDVIAVAAVIVLAIGIGMPSLLHMRDRNQRTMCAQNLARLGVGLQQYASTFGDALPFVGWTSNDSWRPTSAPGVNTVHNRRHLYPLLRAAFVPAQSFVCPSSRGVAMSDDQVRRYDDFLESRNVSYANQNMAGVRGSASRLDASMVLMADDNPLFADGLPLIDFAARGLGLADGTQSNSRSHGGVGQNILRRDGRVEWTTTPNCGVDGDNIWTLSNVQAYTGREGPATLTDSHLLK